MTESVEDHGSSADADTQPGKSESGSRPVVGQWAVIKSSWRDEIARITRVSEKQVRTARLTPGREAHHHPSDILFAGTEKEATDLKSVLKGLDDRHDRNRQQLIEQHRASRAAAIAKATTASSVGISALAEMNQAKAVSQ